MMDINKEIIKNMLATFTNNLGDSFSSLSVEFKNLVEQSFTNLSKRTLTIVKDYKDKKISKEEMEDLLDLQKDNLKLQLLTISGLSQIGLQKAFDAALETAKDGIKDAIEEALS